MKKSLVSLLAGVSMASLLFAGCAKKEVLKKDEAVVPPASVTDKLAADKKAEQAKQADLAEKARLAEQERLARLAEEARLAALKKKSDAEMAAIKLETAYFDFDKADLRADTRDVLTKNAEVIMKSLSQKKIQLEGHCDELGSGEYNMALGERRAQSALNYIKTLGVKVDNITVISYGKEKPAAKGSDDAARAKNRRVEFTIAK